MTPAIAFRLGRISNLPTVWTNVLAGSVLAGGGVETTTVGLMVALSFLYVAGMYLNDAFDHRIDAVERPDRPIPAGEVGAATVFASGFGMLAAGLGLLTWVGHMTAGGWRVGASGAALAAAIVLYDWHHKANPLSPLVMALCRVLVYVVAALAIAATLPIAVVAAAGALFCYLTGLTYAAKYEAAGAVGQPWPLLLLAVPLAYGIGTSLDDPVALAIHIAFIGWVLRAVVSLRRGGRHIPDGVTALIAGISLFDASMIAGQGSAALAVVAMAGFLLTVVLQRRVPGT